LEVQTNDKGEITSPTYLDLIAKINEVIEILSIEKVDDKDLR
ncbi:uncharacterized protein METZ01_LOCUS115395, partial [marine metagenome]